MDWSPCYPAFVDPLAQAELAQGLPKPLRKEVTVADIGCGFGGLLIVLAPMLPDELILGLEIRTQVTEYVQDRISALRSQHAPPSIGGRKIVFPSWTVENDAYQRLPLPADPPEEMNEHIIHGLAGGDKKTMKNTEKALKEITGQNQMPSYQDTQSSTMWVANLAPAQVREIQNLEGVQYLEENKLGTSDKDEALRYYNPTTQEITSSPPPTPYQNISVLRANTMKFLPNFFHKAQLSHIFLCFPDPHFKARKHKQRIVSSTLCAEYAFVLQPGGRIYTITDVEELGTWMKERFAEFGGGQVFERVEVPEEGREREWIEEGGDGRTGLEWDARREVGRMVRAIREETEEGKKVNRNGGRKFVGVWQRREDPGWPGE